MKTLIYGAGTLGCLYAYRLFVAGNDVTLLARGDQYAFIRNNGVVLVNGFTGERESSRVRVVKVLKEDSDILGRSRRVRNILFMGNNALGFDGYLDRLTCSSAAASRSRSSATSTVG